MHVRLEFEWLGSLGKLVFCYVLELRKSSTRHELWDNHVAPLMQRIDLLISLRTTANNWTLQQFPSSWAPVGTLSSSADVADGSQCLNTEPPPIDAMPLSLRQRARIEDFDKSLKACRPRDYTLRCPRAAVLASERIIDDGRKAHGQIHDPEPSLYLLILCLPLFMSRS
jgi:hypothetical protein